MIIFIFEDKERKKNDVLQHMSAKKKHTHAYIRNSRERHFLMHVDVEQQFRKTKVWQVGVNRTSYYE